MELSSNLKPSEASVERRSSRLQQRFKAVGTCGLTATAKERTSVIGEALLRHGWGHLISVIPRKEKDITQSVKCGPQ